MTGRELIEGALRLIGAIAQGETAKAEEMSEALISLNGLLESLSNEGLMIPSSVIEEFPLVGAQSKYTMGSNVLADFNTIRPIGIYAVTIKENGIESSPIGIITQAQWSDIAEKNSTTNRPSKIYIENTNPLETLNLWPVPNTANTIVIYSQKPIAAITNLSTELTLPPGYTRMLRYNLSIEIAPEYGRDPSAIVALKALDSKAELLRKNLKPIYMRSDAIFAPGKTYNVITGD